MEREEAMEPVDLTTDLIARVVQGRGKILAVGRGNGRDHYLGVLALELTDQNKAVCWWVNWNDPGTYGGLYSHEVTEKRRAASVLTCFCERLARITDTGLEPVTRKATPDK